MLKFHQGFDIVLIANLLALPAFKNAFGNVTLPDGSKEVSAAWQSGLTNGAGVGEILGLMISGIVADRIGYRKTMIAALTLVTALIFIVFFTQSLTQLLVGLILVGVPCGVFQTLTTTSLSNPIRRLPHNIRQSLLGNHDDESRLLFPFLSIKFPLVY